ncbi:MAG: BadF/BadG/BcrA/BcrD ATPase family protein, partial [Casimicrobium sp.]
MSATPTIGLGLDAGGTHTRVALARRDELGCELLFEGSIGSLSGTMPATPSGAEQMRGVLSELVRMLDSRALPQPDRVIFGLTGYDDAHTSTSQRIVDIVRDAFANPSLGVRLENDVECAHRAYFANARGHLLYAGTGAIAVFIDENETVHRLGGRGGTIGDEGSAFWIAKTALAAIWRREDETPGAWRNSPLAVILFDAIGGSDWSATRSFLAREQRGEMGLLALNVAACVERDPLADDIV